MHEPRESIGKQRAIDPRMARLWLQFIDMFGSRWVGQYGDCDNGTWANALSCVSDQAMSDAFGRVALSGTEFPPSLPEFLAICARSSGLPDAGTAYTDACHHRWSHQVIYETAKRVGLFELRTRQERDMMPKFREHYGAVCASWMRGERFEVPKTERLEKQATPPCRPEVGMSHLAKMRMMLGGAA